MPTPLSLLDGLTLSVTSAEHGIEPLISERQLQDILGVGRQTPKRWRKAGTGPRYIELGPRRLAYRPSDVKAWLEVRQRTSGRLDSIEHEQELEQFIA